MFSTNSDAYVAAIIGQEAGKDWKHKNMNRIGDNYDQAEITLGQALQGHIAAGKCAMLNDQETEFCNEQGVKEISFGIDGDGSHNFKYKVCEKHYRKIFGALKI